MTHRPTRLARLYAAPTLLCLVVPAPLIAQADSTDAEPQSTVIFDAVEPLELTIRGGLRTLVRDNDDEREEHEATMAVVEANGDTTVLDVQLRVRGNYRRQRRVCNFPPIRLNVKKGQVAGTIFANQDKMKIVTHCQTGRENYEQYILQEYLIYKTFNLFTDRSFRARLARVTWVETERDDEPFTRYAVLLEDEDEVAARLRGAPVEIQGIHPMDIEAETMKLVDVFEYFIGSTDWGVPALHNILVVESDFLYHALPYDFDLAGVINARYAPPPDPSLGIRNIRQRLYRGYCRTPEELQPVFDTFNAKRDEIWALWQGQEGLDPKVLERSLDYFEDFYEVINNEGRIRNEFIRRCRR